MDEIQKRESAVFFVDLLGMGALTEGYIELTNCDRCWFENNDVPFNNQYLAAKILTVFRSLLNEVRRNYQNITIAQLSDGAFIWSQDVIKIIKFVFEFMQKAILKGIFCRGGLSFGEIIETGNSHKLGRLIVGEAVTNAVHLESIAKGSRVMIDDGFIKAERNINGEKGFQIFNKLWNPLNNESYDELLWYIVPYTMISGNEVRLLSDKQKRASTLNRLQLANEVQSSPFFNWNASSVQGKVHINSTVRFLSQNTLLDFDHSCEWQSGIGNRSFSKRDEISRMLNDGCFYRLNTP